MTTNRNGQSADHERLPPHNRDAERAVLGCILRDNRVLDDVAGQVRPADFYVFGHQRVFESMLQLGAAGKPIDYLTLDDVLKRNGWLEDAGGHCYLVDLWDAAPGGTSSAVHYADMIRSSAMVRNVIHLANDVNTLASAPGAAPQELLELIGRRFGELAGQVHVDRIISQPEAVDDYMADLDRRRGRTGDVDAPIKTGWHDLDERIGGLAATELTLVGARPGLGKTLFGACLMRNVAREGVPVFFVSLEQRVREIVGRLLSAEAKVNSRRLREGSVINIDEYGRLLDGADRLRKLPIWYDDEPYQTMFRIAATTRRAKHQHGIRVLVVDYAQLVEPDNPRAHRHEQVGAISRRLKLLARELQIAVVAMAQVNRGAEQRIKQGPRLADLRESGSLEQDADTVLLLHKPDDIAKCGTDPLEVNVAKCRHGPTGEVTLMHDTRHFDVTNFVGPDPQDFSRGPST